MVVAVSHLQRQVELASRFSPNCTKLNNDLTAHIRVIIHPSSHPSMRSYAPFVSTVCYLLETKARRGDEAEEA